MHIFSVDDFFNKVKSIPITFDAIMCAHVIEHLLDYNSLFEVFVQKLSKKGKIYLSTPNINSINFPSTRRGGGKCGTLNFYDDDTHTKMPLNFETVYALCVKHNLKIISYRLKSKSFITYFLGFGMEFLRLFTKKVYPFTYQYWGFEDIYIISK